MNGLVPAQTATHCSGMPISSALAILLALVGVGMAFYLLFVR